jgi:hypothetical protein
MGDGWMTQISRYRKLVFALCLVALHGCAEEKAPIYPDYCEPLKKRFSDREKIEATLMYVIDNIDNPTRYTGETVSYFGRDFLKFYRGIELSKESNKSIIKGYLDRNPDCCAVLRPPSYVKWYASARPYFPEHEIIGSPGEWVVDVSLSGPNRKSGDFKVSDCNKVGMIDRG